MTLRILLTLWLSLALCASALAQDRAGTQLGREQAAILPIAAFAAMGNTEKLGDALQEGLKAGLSVNAIREILIQLYAYAGFPRSLTALDTFRSLLEERKAAGIADSLGPEPKALPAGSDRLATGKKIQTELTGRTVSGPLYDFAPEMNVFLREHLFCDIFTRGILTNQERELATISILAALPAPRQLASHLRVCRHIGLTEGELRQSASILRSKVSASSGELMDNLINSMYSQDSR